MARTPGSPRPTSTGPAGRGARPGRPAPPAAAARKGGKRREAQGVDLDAMLISVHSLWVAVGVVALIAASVGIWYFGFRRPESPEARAKREVAEASDLASRAAVSPGFAPRKSDYEAGEAALVEARNALAEKSFDLARTRAFEAQGKFKTVIADDAKQGDASFYEVEGSVQVQRGAAGTWEPARIKMSLTDGDFVKTGANGTAQVRYNDGQVHEIRPDTLFEVKKRIDPATKKGTAEIKMTKGVVSIITTGEKSRVITPANTVVEQLPDTKGEVSVAEDNSARVSVYEGQGSTVQTSSGEKISLASRERVEQKADLSLAPKVVLPEPPVLVRPVDNQTFDPKTVSTVSMSWNPVPAAGRYHLQVSRSRFFVQPEIDVADRTTTDSTVRVLHEGSYFWRVAAVSATGVRGEFSPFRRFRFAGEVDTSRATGPAGVTSTAAGTAPAQRPAPTLTMDPVSPIGNLLLLAGQTDPGAVVSVNGQPANVDATGRWSYSYSFTQVGLNRITIRATTGGVEAKIEKTYDYQEQ